MVQSCISQFQFDLKVLELSTISIIECQILITCHIFDLKIFIGWPNMGDQITIKLLLVHVVEIWWSSILLLSFALLLASLGLTAFVFYHQSPAEVLFFSYFLLTALTYIATIPRLFKNPTFLHGMVLGRDFYQSSKKESVWSFCCCQKFCSQWSKKDKNGDMWVSKVMNVATCR